MTPILAAGDFFILPELFESAVRRCAPADARLSFRHFQTPWPRVPFGDVAEVTEASGSEDEMIAALKGIDIVVANHAPLTARVIENSRLSFAVAARGGATNVNLSAARAAGLRVSNAPGRNAAATAEHSVAMMLAALRRIPESDAQLRQGIWRGDFYEYEASGGELGAARVGLIGFGQIGARVARIVSGFGAQVGIYDPYADAVEQYGERFASLEALLEWSTIVSLHARATAETRNMINADTLALLPRGAVLVNCARGSLVDEAALCDALANGQLGAAALDVFAHEPLSPGDPLLSAPNLVITPHIAGASRETALLAAQMAGEEVGRYLRGEPLRHEIT
jgi:D-3-phosphoglycerate dehydrogenase